MPVRASVRVLVLLALVVGAAACKEEAGVKVSSLKVTGTKAVTAGQLKSVLATASSSKIPWGTKRYFSRDQFDADLKRIVAFYKDRGYPDARVTSFDVALNQDQTAVSITLNISEGEPVRVERIVMEGFEPLPAEHRQALDGKLPLQTGQPLDRALLQASREAALDELKDHGYPYAAVRLSDEAGSSERQRVIHLKAEPGPIAHHGPVEISGNSSVGDNVVRRQLTFRPGDLYRQSKLVESQRKLYGQELFEFVNIEPLRLEDRSAEIPTRVTLTEGKHRKVNFGIGYGTEEQARAEVDWRHVNFFGGARTAGVFARYSGLDRGLRLNLKEPYFFSPRLTLTLSGQAWHADEPLFTLDTLGGRATVTRQFARAGGPVLGSRPSTTLAFTYANEYDDFSISTDALNEALTDDEARDLLIGLGLDFTKGGQGEGHRSALIIDASRNTTENLLDARQGYVATLHLEQAGTWLGGSSDYYELTAEGRFYQTLGGRAVLAVKARAGSIDALGPQDTKVPFFKRYFLGGATNLRGWGRFDVAPLSASGLPIGGGAFLDFSTEVRAPVWKNLGAVVFLDGGNVWTEPWDFHLNDLRYDVGPGLRYQTPIGPIRFDVGYQLNPIAGLRLGGKEQTRRFHLHFSIGQAF
jgi:outer membrane protein assembly complex protein YaeT